MHSANIALFERDPDEDKAIRDALQGTPFAIDERACVKSAQAAQELAPKLYRLHIDLVILDVRIAKGQKGMHASEIIIRKLAGSPYEGRSLGIYDEEHFWNHGVRVDYAIPRAQVPLLPKIIEKQL